MKKLITISILLGTLCIPVSRAQNLSNADPIAVIIDTDMGNDIDDALALDMVYKYVDMGKFNLLGIMNNKDSQYSTAFIDIMNTWYGYPNVPIGKIENGVVIDDYVNYATNVCNLKKEGKPLFEQSIADHSTLKDAHILYREILAKQPDQSVTIISIGFSTNIARLLDTPADKHSDLTGKELVAAKVKLLSVMAGSLVTNPRKEFNVVHDIPAAQKVFAEWPSNIVVAPFELGVKVQFPASCIQNDFDWGMEHPLVVGYNNYRPMPYNRATWDLMSVLYVAEQNSDMLTSSVQGSIIVTDEAITVFTPETNGKHKYLTINEEQAKSIKKYFIDLITKRPNKYVEK